MVTYIPCCPTYDVYNEHNKKQDTLTTSLRVGGKDRKTESEKEQRPHLHNAENYKTKTEKDKKLKFVSLFCPYFWDSVTGMMAGRANVSVAPSYACKRWGVMLCGSLAAYLRAAPLSPQTLLLPSLIFKLMTFSVNWKSLWCWVNSSFDKSKGRVLFGLCHFGEREESKLKMQKP